MEFAEPIKCLSFSKSSNILALGMDGSLFLFSVPNRSMIVSKTYGSSIRSLSFSNHDERLAVALSDGTLSLLCPDDDWQSAGEIDYSDSPIICQDWCTNTFAIGREDGSVAIFDLEKGLGELRYGTCAVDIGFHHDDTKVKQHCIRPTSNKSAESTSGHLIYFL